MRIFDKAEGAPERIVDDGAVLLQLGGETTIDDGATAGLLDQIVEYILLGVPILYSHLNY